MGSGLCACNKDGNNNGNPILIKADILLADNYPNKNNLTKNQDENNIVKKNQESETNSNNNHNNENDENENYDNNSENEEENDKEKSEDKEKESKNEEDEKEDIKEDSEDDEKGSNNNDENNLGVVKIKNGKDELINKFDELIKPYASYISDIEFKNATKGEISKIEKSLEIINQENDLIKI